jgi:Helix-turn-helix domain
MSSNGFTLIPNAIARDGIVPVNERVVLIVLASHAGSEGACRLLRSTLVRESGISRASVTRALKWLTDKGYVTIVHNSGSMGRASSTYRLNLTVYQDVTVDEDDGGEAQAEPGLGSQGAGVRLTGSTSEAHTEPTREEEPFKKTLEESPSEKSSPSVSTSPEDGGINHDDLFEKWWKLYPKSENKSNTLVAYQSAYAILTTGGATAWQAHDILLEGVKGYLRKIKADNIEHQFVKYSVNWLREKRWEDKYPPAPKKPNRWQRPVAE